MIKNGVKDVFIAQGEPLCYIVPFKREEYNLVLQNGMKSYLLEVLNNRNI